MGLAPRSCSRARGPRATDIVGVITKRAIADAVIGAYDD
jgi:hypothetical protein